MGSSECCSVVVWACLEAILDASRGYLGLPCGNLGAFLGVILSCLGVRGPTKPQPFSKHSTCLLGHLGAALVRLGPVLGLSWVVLGPSSGCFSAVLAHLFKTPTMPLGCLETRFVVGPILGYLGAALARLGPIFGRSWAILGQSWAVLACLGAFLGLSWGQSWPIFQVTQHASWVS